ncbi:acetylserotonin O-methyltransferase (plasmid) [Rhizobium leguminosarum]|uniref:methyltransferase n=1 Tax=Rhizobium leguminosarum TaxID=384 RepID=UPI0004B525BF|nr:methyltransferase [Rhizobium leguminosarum]UIK01244.1 acetylserotonin O-methyltransferase [Rhizobium leguminosarum]UIL30290.1 acetylserotonin O-methyltransferase [Rhizobium leguminosarum]WFT90939.1 methyltransferase [Rhizobium leguminosarum]
MTATVNQAEQVRHDLVMLFTGGWRAQALYSAVKLGLPDLIASGHTTSPSMAVATGASQEGIRRLLRFLVSIAVFDGNDRTGYSNTATSQKLTNTPGSLRDMCLLYGEECYTAWGEAHGAISSLTSGFAKAFGTPFYDYLGQNADVAARFQNVMNAQNGFAIKVPEVFDFAGKSVVDVGGGGGQLLATILDQVPDARGTLFDREHMIPEARAFLHASVGADRVDLVSGDMFCEIPAGGDVYLFSRVLAGWQDDVIVKALTTCRSVMQGNTARLIIIDRLVKDEGSGVMSALWDLHLLVTIGGRHRTLESFAAVLDRSGFAIERTADLPGETTAIIAAAKAALSQT